MTFNGYRSYVGNATGMAIGIKSVDYNPQGGQFLVESTNPFNTGQNTTIIPSSNNSTSCLTDLTATVTSVPTRNKPIYIYTKLIFKQTILATRQEH